MKTMFIPALVSILFLSLQNKIWSDTVAYIDHGITKNNEVIIRFKKDTSDEDILGLIKNFNMSILRREYKFNLWCLKYGSGISFDTITSYTNKNVIFSQPNYIYKLPEINQNFILYETAISKTDTNTK